MRISTMLYADPYLWLNGFEEQMHVRMPRNDCFTPNIMPTRLEV